MSVNVRLYGIGCECSCICYAARQAVSVLTRIYSQSQDPVRYKLRMTSICCLA